MMAWQWAILVPLMGVCGYMVGRWSRPKGSILCTPQDVVEAVLEELEVSAYQLGRNATYEEAEEYDRMFAERIAANLIQITEQKGR